MTETQFHQLKQGTLLSGKYRIEGILGEGGFGITYLAEDVMLEMKVAIKEYYPAGFVTREVNNGNTVTAFTGDKGSVFAQGKEKFIYEARTLGRLSGLPGIVNVRDYFQENNTAYIVMEFLEGITLKGYLKQAGGKISSDEMLSVLQPVVKALAEVHKQGLIHRDISPDNIMILLGDQVKLMDFGAARDISVNGEKSLSVMLKPGYAPEEQYRTRGEQGPWSDIYALCATAYRCITGVVPVESMERIRKDELKTPSALGISIDSKKEKVLMKGLAVFKEDRIQNAEELYHLWYGGDKYKIAIKEENSAHTEKNEDTDKAKAKEEIKRRKEEQKAEKRRPKEVLIAERLKEKEEAKAKEAAEKSNENKEKEVKQAFVESIHDKRLSPKYIGLILAGCVTLLLMVGLFLLLNKNNSKLTIEESWRPVYASSPIGAIYDENVVILVSKNALYYGEFNLVGEIRDVYWLADLTVDEKITSVAVSGEDIYVSVKNYGIWCAEIGNQQLDFKQIVPGVIDKFVVYNDYVYYVEEEILYRVSVTEQEKYIVNKDVSDIFTVYGDKLFVYNNEEKNIYWMNLDGSKQEVLSGYDLSGDISDLLVVGNTLYFCDSRCHQINLETNEHNILGVRGVSADAMLFYWNESICFESFGDICCLNTETGVSTTLYEDGNSEKENIRLYGMLGDKLVVVSEDNKYHFYEEGSNRPYVPIFRYNTLVIKAIR